MARITVNEVDNSWYARPEAEAPIVVYAPGITTFGPEEPTLVNLTTFNRRFGILPVGVDDLQYEIVRSYLANGATVLFHRMVPNDATKAFAKIGTDASAELKTMSTPLDESTSWTYKVSAVTAVKGDTTPTGLTADATGYIIPKDDLSGHVSSGSITYKATVSGGVTTWFYHDASDNKDYKREDLGIELKSTSTSGLVDGDDYAVTLTLEWVENTDSETKKDVDDYIGITGQSQVDDVVGIKVTSGIEKTVEYSYTDYNVDDGFKMPDYTESVESVTVDEVDKTSEWTYSDGYLKYTAEGELPAFSTVSVKYTATEYELHDIIPTCRVDSKYFGSTGNNIVVKFMDPVVDSYDRVKCYVRIELGKLYEVAALNDFKSSDIDSEYVTVSVKSGLPSDKLRRLIHSYKETRLTGGSDGTVANAFDDFVKRGDIVNQLSDKLINDFDVATSVGFPEAKEFVSDDGKTTFSFRTQMRQVVESRGDAVYLIDEELDVNPEDAFASWTDINSSYLAAYGPWCSSQLLSIGVTRRTPATYPVILSWISSINKGNPLWFAPAGVKRASLNVVSSTVFPMGSKQIAEWVDNDDVEGAIYQANPIVRLKQYGYVAYNDATLYHKRPSGEQSALNQIGTRVLANNIKKKALNISLGLQFDQMSNQLIVEFKTLLSTYLETLVYQGGISGYEILIGETGTAFTATELNTKTIPVVIRISPMPAVRNFDITLDISQAGLVFSSEE